MNEQPVKKGGRLCAALFDDVPLGTKIAAVLALVAGLLHLLSCLHTSVADFLNDTVGVAARALMAALTNAIPFSVAEMLLLSLLPLVVLFIVFAVRAAGDGVRYGAGVVGDIGVGTLCDERGEPLCDYLCTKDALPAQLARSLRENEPASENIAEYLGNCV